MGWSEGRPDGRSASSPSRGSPPSRYEKRAVLISPARRGGEQFLQESNHEIGLSYEGGVARLPLAHVGAARGHLPLQARVDGPVLCTDDVSGRSLLPAVVFRDASPAAGGLRTQQANRPGGERFGTVAIESVGSPV